MTEKQKARAWAVEYGICQDFDNDDAAEMLTEYARQYHLALRDADRRADALEELRAVMDRFANHGDGFWALEERIHELEEAERWKGTA